MRHRLTSSNTRVWLFLVLALASTWAFWIPAAFISQRSQDLGRLFQTLGGAMPLAMTVILLFWRGDARERQNFLHRAIDINRISLVWAVAALLTVPVLTGTGIAADRLLGGNGVAIEAELHGTSVWQFVSFTLFILLFGPIPEELAWRGYALDHLQARYNPLHASLILGSFWLIWHLPLFFVSGSYQQGLGIGTPAFWLFLADKIPQTIIMTLIFNHTRRSILSAILFHFSVNFTGELLALTNRAETVYIALLISLSVLAAFLITRKASAQVFDIHSTRSEKANML